MKVLTVRQPWAGAMFAAPEVRKDVENRSRLSSHRGLLAIHAGASVADAAGFASVEQLLGHVPVLGMPREGTQWALGAVIGVVDLTDAHRPSDCPGGRVCSPWAMAGHNHHVLGRPRLLTAPVPALGRLGLWTADDDLETQIRRHLP